MEIKLITGATAYEAGINTIKKIDVTNLDFQNIVVVPDAFSMQAESLIFDCLNIKSTFNIEVVGVSRLASKILRQNNIAFSRISSLEEIFTVFKAVKIVKDKMTYFSSFGVDMCQKILQIIKQFKSCKIKPEQIKSVGDDNLDRKMHDLKLIYEQYETILGEKLDLSKLLDFFVENAKIALDLSKINLFFVNFDSFTLEINSFICSLAKFVHSVYIGRAKPLSVKNAYIYEDDIFKKTTALAKEFALSVAEENYPTTLSGPSRAIVENLFAFQIDKCENNHYFLNVLAKNRRDEVEYVAKYIKNAIFYGKKFNNFAVAVANSDYYDLIKTSFAQFDIPVNCDDAVDLSETVLGHFLSKILEIAKTGFDRAGLEYLASSPLVTKDEQILNGISYFCVDDEKEFLERFPQFEKLIFSIKSLSKCKKMRNFVEILKDIMLFVAKNHQTLVEELEEERFYQKQSENKQSVELFLQVLDKLVELGVNEDFSLEDFENVFSLALKSVKVETIPSYIDAVYVGDVTDSYFEDVDTLFVLGASAGALPRTQNDVGFIDDEDIKKLKLQFALEPEIRVLNRRNRLKLFEVLQHAKKKLIVCLPMSENGKQNTRAEFVEDLRKIFGGEVLHTVAFEQFDIGLLSSEENLDKLIFYVGCNENLMNAYSNLKAKQKLPREFESALFSLLKTKIYVDEPFEELVYERAKKTISASELENFFACPFKRFLRYDLGVDEKVDITPNKRLFGVFMHELLRIFCNDNQNLGCLTDDDVDKFLKTNMMPVAQKFYDKKVLEKIYFVKFLTNESKIILKNVIKEQKNSDFRPIMLEEKIYEPFFDGLSLVGVVDRVDKCGNYFRVIDYKTGKTDNIKKDLYYGNKLQLFLYASAVGNRTKLDCSGVYYFNCQTKYSKGNAKTKLFNGITLKRNEIVEMSDKSLVDGGRSEILGVSVKASAKSGEFRYKYGSVEENLTNYFDYAREVSKQAVGEIKSGYVAMKPLKNKCGMCPYLAICKHSQAQGYRDMKKEGD